MTDIAEKKNMNISLLSKDKQEAIHVYEKFGQNMEKKEDINQKTQWVKIILLWIV